MDDGPGVGRPKNRNTTHWLESKGYGSGSGDFGRYRQAGVCYTRRMTTDELTSQFVTFQGELKSFLLRLTANVQDAEDIVQDTYLKAQSKIDTFRGDSSLKTWVFRIASNLAIDLLRSQKRWPENVTDICKEEALGNKQFFQEAMHIRQTSPQGHFEIKEHIATCFTCVSKSLPLEGHLVILLKEVYGFKVKEIAHNRQVMEKYLQNFD